jgi:hypothetical protein
MNIEVKRAVFNDTCTIGKMYIDNAFFCYTLEDKVRPTGAEKIPGQTAIPAGTYNVIIDFSNRFQRDMPHILNVPGFDGIRIHCGNTDKDTEGCILIGLLLGICSVGKSRDAFDKFFPLLEGALKNSPVAITIGSGCES